MRLVQPISEDDMIAAFLCGELRGRYGEKIRTLARADLDLLLDPDTHDAEANDVRRRILEEHRAYERRDGLFLGFPRAVDWHRAALSRDELLDIRYIDWDWWLTVSAGTRSARVAAQRIRSGAVPGQTAEEDEPIAAALAGGGEPPLIAVTTPAHAPLVLVEGHVRLTAYALFPEYVPDELEILLGISDEMPGWCQF